MPGLTFDDHSTGTCMYSMTKDEHFIFDWHPAFKEKAIMIGGLSGHGYKFAPAFGKLVEDWFKLGQSEFYSDIFKLKQSAIKD